MLRVDPLLVREGGQLGVKQADFVDVVLLDVVLVELCIRVKCRPALDLIFDDCLSHARAIVALQIEELAEDPCQPLRLAHCQVFALE